MTFRPKIWAPVVAACYPPDMRESITALWLAHPGYFFDMHPAPTRELKLDSGPVMLFERSPETFHVIRDIFQELTENDFETDWDHINTIWADTKPWWDAFERVHDQEHPVCILRDPDDYANGARVARDALTGQVSDYIDEEIVFAPAWQYPAGAANFMQMFTIPYDFLDLLRPTITGNAEIEFADEAVEEQTAVICTHLIYGLRAFYIWLAEQRIHMGTQLLEKLTRFDFNLSFPSA